MAEREVDHVRRNPDLRVGDAEREAVAAQLREHYARGRLTHEELTERLDACLAARTSGDLEPLLADLPAEASSLPGPVRRATRWGGVWRHWASASVIVWGIWGVGVATGAGEQGLWPLWVSGPWGAAILAGTIRGDAPGGPLPDGRAELRRTALEQRADRRAERARLRADRHSRRR